MPPKSERVVFRTAIAEFAVKIFEDANLRYFDPYSTTYDGLAIIPSVEMPGCWLIRGFNTQSQSFDRTGGPVICFQVMLVPRGSSLDRRDVWVRCSGQADSRSIRKAVKLGLEDLYVSEQYGIVSSSQKACK